MLFYFFKNWLASWAELEGPFSAGLKPGPTADKHGLQSSEASSQLCPHSLSMAALVFPL